MKVNIVEEISIDEALTENQLKIVQIKDFSHSRSHSKSTSHLHLLTIIIHHLEGIRRMIIEGKEITERERKKNIDKRRRIIQGGDMFLHQVKYRFIAKSVN